MIYVYHNNPNIEFWLERITCEFESTSDLASWLSKPVDSRISLHEEVEFNNSNLSTVEFLVNNSRTCIIFVPELIDNSWFSKFDQSNVVFFIAGKLNNLQGRVLHD